ncbi:helix-turn-helix transcriptional regulator [Streptomyces sp. NPDC090108]|uniref:helix-turn-helix domain-containing protein n=1 Tax=Streptomyces sp. NPDC090108 TaxID=3365947 RepID=UPI00381D4476
MSSVDQVVGHCLPDEAGGTSAAAESLLRALALGPPLTETEEKILDLLRGGPTNAEIAGRLGITTRTVKFHVSNLRVKYCGLSRLQLCLLATLRRLDPVAAGTAVGPAGPEVSNGVRGVRHIRSRRSTTNPPARLR